MQVAHMLFPTNTQNVSIFLHSFTFVLSLSTTSQRFNNHSPPVLTSSLINSLTLAMIASQKAPAATAMTNITHVAVNEICPF